MTPDKIDEIRAIWEAADKFDRPWDVMTQAALWEAAGSQIPMLLTEIRRLEIEVGATFLSGYMSGAANMKTALQKTLRSHYDGGLATIVENAPIPAP